MPASKHHPTSVYLGCDRVAGIAGFDAVKSLLMIKMRLHEMGPPIFMIISDRTDEPDDSSPLQTR
jgi:hypothetical protein